MSTRRHTGFVERKHWLVERQPKDWRRSRIANHPRRIKYSQRVYDSHSPFFDIYLYGCPEYFTAVLNITHTHSDTSMLFSRFIPVALMLTFAAIASGQPAVKFGPHMGPRYFQQKPAFWLEQGLHSNAGLKQSRIRSHAPWIKTPSPRVGNRSKVHIVYAAPRRSHALNNRRRNTREDLSLQKDSSRTRTLMTNTTRRPSTNRALRTPNRKATQGRTAGQFRDSQKRRGQNKTAKRSENNRQHKSSESQRKRAKTRSPGMRSSQQVKPSNRAKSVTRKPAARSLPRSASTIPTQRILSKDEVNKRYDTNGDGALDFREKMTFLRSLDEEQKAAYRKEFAKIGPTRTGPSQTTQPKTTQPKTTQRRASNNRPTTTPKPAGRPQRGPQGIESDRRPNPNANPNANRTDKDPQRILSKDEVNKRYDTNGDGALDFREKTTFLRSLNEEQKAAYRKQFAKIGQAKIGPTKSAQPESAEKR